MTETEKSQIIRLKVNGWGYKRIAAELGISENTVKSFLKRNQDYCPMCGKPISGRQKYCSDKCRMQWWRSHPHQTAGMRLSRCGVCGAAIYSHPSKQRKFCSRKCYGISCRKEHGDDK